jgi:hypothetical protein
MAWLKVSFPSAFEGAAAFAGTLFAGVRFAAAFLAEALFFVLFI